MEHATDIEANAFQARFKTVPGIVADWVGRKLNIANCDVLDFGCGEGISALGFVMNHFARRVVGVDIMPDPERCLQTAQRHINIRALPKTLELHRVKPGTLHASDDQFDLIYSWSVFEHVDQRLLDCTLEMLRSVLKPNGLLMIQIAPLFYSAEGSHLNHKLPEPWVHLATQESILYERLALAVSDKNELDELWSTYQTLNRVTAIDLERRVLAAGFQISRKYTTSDEIAPPSKLSEIIHNDVLTTNQVVLLASPH